jgi:hypothetical protein
MSIVLTVTPTHLVTITLSYRHFFTVVFFVKSTLKYTVITVRTTYWFYLEVTLFHSE